MKELDRYDAFVMGRVSYEGFRENWGAGGNPYIDRIGATGSVPLTTVAKLLGQSMLPVTSR